MEIVLLSFGFLFGGAVVCIWEWRKFWWEIISKRKKGGKT